LQNGKSLNGYRERMRDSEVVASIVAGDPEGLAVAYDRYSGPLFGYCQSLLRQPEDSADAVQDTFVIAASKLGRLRDPERLRAWLFAVARNECLRRLKSTKETPTLDDLPEQPDESVDVGGEAERAESRALIRAAVAGLNDGERDVINQLWHGLEVPEVAMVLGVSRNHAHSLFSRARVQLEASVAVLLVGRSGRQDCAALDELLQGWDGRLTAAVRRRVGRHIDRCAVCSDRRRQELKPALLLSLAPGALLGLGAARDGIGSLAGVGGSGGPGSVGSLGQPVAPLTGLRPNVLHLATDSGRRAAAYRAAAGQGTRSFHLTGFPRASQSWHLGLSRMAHLPASAAGGTVAAATATVVVLAVVPHGAHPVTAGHGPGGALVTAGTASVASTAGPARTATGGGTARGGPLAGRPSASGTRPALARHQSGPSPSGAATATSPSTGAPSGSATAPGGTPTTTPTTSDPTATPSPSVSVSASAPLTGALALSTTTVELTLLGHGTLTLTASGGPVSWSISEPSSLLGSLTVSPSAGTLAAGDSVTVQISVTGLASLATTLTVNPGGQTVAVVLGLG
jgi:RNA polymerase sigma factor (sigma-70 family)